MNKLDHIIRKSAGLPICRLFFKVLYLATGEARFYRPDIPREWHRNGLQYRIGLFYKGNLIGYVTRGHLNCRAALLALRDLERQWKGAQFRIIFRGKRTITIL